MRSGECAVLSRKACHCLGYFQQALKGRSFSTRFPARVDAGAGLHKCVTIINSSLRHAVSPMLPRDGRAWTCMSGRCPRAPLTEETLPDGWQGLLNCAPNSAPSIARRSGFWQALKPEEHLFDEQRVGDAVGCALKMRQATRCRDGPAAQSQERCKPTHYPANVWARLSLAFGKLRAAETSVLRSGTLLRSLLSGAVNLPLENGIPVPAPSTLA